MAKFTYPVPASGGGVPAASINQDRNTKLIEGGTWSYDAGGGSSIIASNNISDAFSSASDANTLHGTSFTNASAINFTSATFHLQRSGTQSGTLVVEIYADNGIDGKPTGSPLGTSDAVNVTTVTGTSADIAFNFSTPVALSGSTIYHAVVNFSSVLFTSGEFLFSRDSTDSYLGGREVASVDGGSNWGLGDDLRFSFEGSSGAFNLTNDADAYLEVSGLERERNTIDAQTINFPNANSVAHVEVNRSGSGATSLTVDVSDVDSMTVTDNTVIIARRVSDGILIGRSFLLEDGESSKLDETGNTAAKIKYDNSASGTTATDLQAATDEIEARVDLNDAKVSADGSVTTHNDVTDAGSGAIITGTERTKLIGIEDGAEVNQTDAEIKTQYENNADTNAFTDAEQTKLAGIEAGATGDQIAAEVSYDNSSSGLTATDLQAATDEIEGRVDTLESTPGGDQWGDPVDANIIPDSVSNNREIGDSTDYFRRLHVREVRGPNDNSFTVTGGATNSASGRPINVQSGGGFTGQNSGTATFKSQASFSADSGTVNLESGDTFTSGASGTVNIESGNASGGSNSGDINIRTGTSTGTRGSLTLDANAISASSTQINDVADPTLAQDAATKNYVDTQVSGIDLSGKMDTNFSNAAAAANDIDLNSNKLVNVADPTVAQDAATKNYVDTEISTIDISGKADTDLGNIIQITTNLISSSSGLNLGSSGNRWGTLFCDEVRVKNSSNGDRLYLYGDVGITPSGTGSNGAMVTFNQDIITMTSNKSGTTNSNNIRLESGNVVDGTSGDIIIRPGAVSGTGTKGKIDVTSSQISNVLDPTLAQDAATKAYVDAQGGGLKNYLSNANSKFEDASDDWVTYNDGGSTSTDGTGGTATQVVLSTTTVAAEVLEGSQSKKIAVAASAQGEGVSVTTLPIDNIDVNTECYIRIGHDATDANYTVGDMIIELYDVTNATKIPLIQGDNTIPATVGKVEKAFIMPDTAEIRLILHCATNNGSAYDIFIDEVEISPDRLEVNIPYVRSATIDLTGSGNFTAGVIQVERIENTVNITTTTAITYASATSASSAAGVIPEWARPVLTKGNIVRSSSLLYEIRSEADGTLSLNTRNSSFTPTNTTGDFGFSSISYNVDDDGQSIAGTVKNTQLDFQSATSDLKTPAGSAQWHAHTNNSVTLKAGREYELYANGRFTTSGGTASYSYTQVGIFAANGADALPDPTYLTASADLEVLSAQNSQAGQYGTAVTDINARNSMRVRVRVINDVDVYAVTYASMLTPANARVQAFLNASEVPFSQTAIVQQNKVAKLFEEQAANTNGDSSTAGTKDAVLNSSDDPFGIIGSLSSNEFTFSSTGKYYIQASLPAYKTGRHRGYLTTSGNSILLKGTSAQSDGGDFTQTVTLITGYLDVTDTSQAYKLRHFAQLGTGIFGVAANNGAQEERYNEIQIWKIGE